MEESHGFGESLKDEPVEKGIILNMKIICHTFRNRELRTRY